MNKLTKNIIINTNLNVNIMNKKTIFIYYLINFYIKNKYEITIITDYIFDNKNFLDNIINTTKIKIKYYKNIIDFIDKNHYLYKKIIIINDNYLKLIKNKKWANKIVTVLNPNNIQIIKSLGKTKELWCLTKYDYEYFKKKENKKLFIINKFYEPQYVFKNLKDNNLIKFIYVGSLKIQYKFQDLINQFLELKKLNKNIQLTICYNKIDKKLEYITNENYEGIIWKYNLNYQKCCNEIYNSHIGIIFSELNKKTSYKLIEYQKYKLEIYKDNNIINFLKENKNPIFKNLCLEKSHSIINKETLKNTLIVIDNKDYLSKANDLKILLDADLLVYNDNDNFSNYKYVFLVNTYFELKKKEKEVYIYTNIDKITDLSVEQKNNIKKNNININSYFFNDSETKNYFENEFSIKKKSFLNIKGNIDYKFFVNKKKIIIYGKNNDFSLTIFKILENYIDMYWVQFEYENKDIISINCESNIINIYEKNSFIHINDFILNKNEYLKFEYIILALIESCDNNYIKTKINLINDKLLPESNIYINFNEIMLEDNNKNLNYINYLFIDYKSKLYYNTLIDYNNLDILFIIDKPKSKNDLLINSFKFYIKNYLVILDEYFDELKIKAKKIITYEYSTYFSKKNKTIFDNIIISDFQAFKENTEPNNSKKSLELLIKEKKEIFVTNSNIKNMIVRKYNYFNIKNIYEKITLETNYEIIRNQKNKIIIGIIGNTMNDECLKLIKNFNIRFSLKIINSDELINTLLKDIDIFINTDNNITSDIILYCLSLGKPFISIKNSLTIDIIEDAKLYNLKPCILYDNDKELIHILNNFNNESYDKLINDSIIYSKISKISSIRTIYFLKLIKLKYNKISIVIPHYNTKNDYLIKMLDSINYQTGLNDIYTIETIIIDDCSDISFYNNLFNLSSKYKNLNIRLMRLNKNQGISTALHIGILESNNSLIVRMDSDDIMLKDRLLYQLYMYEYYENKYSNKDLIILGNYVLRIDEKFNYVSKNIKPTPKYLDNKNYMKHEKIFTIHPTTCFNKEKFLKLGNYPPFFKLNAEDLITWVNILNKNGIIINDENITTLYRKHSSQTSKNKIFLNNTINLIKNLTNLNDIKKNFYNINYKSLIDSS